MLTAARLPKPNPWWIDLPNLVLKIDVDTFRGTREGVPNLVRLLQKHQAHATFLFSLGPDHTGWALRRAFRPGFFSKVSRTSVLEHYGLKTLMYGVLLPAPDIGKTCANQMRAVRDAGFECGIHTWDHTLWQDNVQRRDAAWAQHQMQQAYDRFVEIFGETPKTHGAAGWQMNRAALQQLDLWNIPYASDGRVLLNENGTISQPANGPHRLDLAGKPSTCIQLPTTLPTLDELLGRTLNGAIINTNNVASVLLNLTRSPRDHVYTLHAELEGQKLAPVFEKLLAGWRAQGYTLTSMRDAYQQQKETMLPISQLNFGELPGRSGTVLLQD